MNDERDDGRERRDDADGPDFDTHDDPATGHAPVAGDADPSRASAGDASAGETFTELSAAFIGAERDDPADAPPDDDGREASTTPPPDATEIDGAAGDEDDGRSTEDDEPPSASGPSRRTLVALTVLASLLFVSTAAFAALWWTERADDRTRRDVEAVAGAFTTNLVSFDYRTLEADLAQTAEYATGAFERQFTEALGGDVTVFRDAIREAQASSEGTLHGVAVQEIDGDTATAVVVVSQTINNKESPEPRTQLQVLELTLVRTASGWKVDNVDTVGGSRG